MVDDFLLYERRINAREGKEVIYTELTNKAMRIAYDAHQGQVDKCGQPYIFHPYHLAEQMDDEITVCIALLHDVMEDTEVTFEELSKEFPKEVMDALRLLTHKKGTDYFEYVRAIKQNPYATAVKLADLAHNSDQSRMVGCEWISEETKKALREKYAKAKAILEDGAGEI